MKNIILVALMSVLITACGDVTIDATSKESMQASIAEMKEDLTPDQRSQLEDAIKVVAFSNITSFKDIMQMGMNPDLTVNNVTTRLHGLNYKQVLAESEKVKEERRQKKIAEAKAKLKEAETKLSNLNRDKQAIANNLKLIQSKLLITNAQIAVKKITYSEKVQISFEVQNNLSTPVSRVYLSGKLTTPGRSVPWVQDDLNFSIKGGLEPGEKQSLVLTPNMFSNWGKFKDITSDMVLELKPYQVDSGPGKDGINGRLSEYDLKDIKRAEDKVARLQGVIAQQG